MPEPGPFTITDFIDLRHENLELIGDQVLVESAQYVKVNESSILGGADNCEICELDKSARKPRKQCHTINFEQPSH